MQKLWLYLVLSCFIELGMYASQENTGAQRRTRDQRDVAMGNQLLGGRVTGLGAQRVALIAQVMSKARDADGMQLEIVQSPKKVFIKPSAKKIAEKGPWVVSSSTDMNSAGGSCTTTVWSDGAKQQRFTGQGNSLPNGSTVMKRPNCRSVAVLGDPTRDAYLRAQKAKSDIKEQRDRALLSRGLGASLLLE